MNPHSRIPLLFYGLLFSGLTAFTPEVRAKDEAKPNIIVVIFDDLNDSVSGLGGHPQAKTPNLERLMSRGVSFQRAYSNSPLCAPSRASLLTGTYPHTTGVFDAHYKKPIGKYWREFPKLTHAKTFMEHFRDNGYAVYGTGKIFHNGEEDWSVWLDPVTGQMNFGEFPSWGPYPWDGAKPYVPYRVCHTNGTQHSSFEQYPFVHRLEFFTDLSDIPSVAPNPENGTPGYTGWQEFGRAFRYENENNRDQMCDEKSAEYISTLLSKKHEKPFLMCVGIVRPHGPYIAPKKYFDRFPLETIQLAEVNEQDHDDIAGILAESQLVRGKKNGYLKYKQHDLAKRWTQAYLACVNYADDQFGKILDALDESEYAENTLVVVVSDHGFQMGEKLSFFKFTLWEESNRIPFIMAGPGIPEGETVGNPVSLIDLYPTLIDVAGLPGTPHPDVSLEGFSVMPLAQNVGSNDWAGPDIALSEVGYVDASAPGGMLHHYSARSEDFRYILCSNGEEELYDHRVDPQEWTNLAADPAYYERKTELKSRVKKMLAGSEYQPVYETEPSRN